jgi:cytochrome c
VVIPIRIAQNVMDKQSSIMVFSPLRGLRAFSRRLSAVAAAAAIAGLTTVLPAAASEALAAKAACVACHAVDRKGVGPSYKEIAARYKGDPKAAALLAQRVRKGSSGVWGAVPMPPTPPDRLSDAELKTLVAWLLKP